MQWPYSSELDDNSKHEMTLSQKQDPCFLPLLSSASGRDPDARFQKRSYQLQPPFQSQLYQHQGQELPQSKAQNRDGGNYNQSQRSSNNNDNSDIGIPSNNNFDNNRDSKQPGSVDQPCNHNPTQSRQQQNRQAPLVQLINGVHPDRLAMILEEQRIRAAPPPAPAPAKRPTQQTRSAPRHLPHKKKTLALASQPPCLITQTPAKKPQKKTPPAPATKKASKSTPSTPDAAANEAVLAFELLLEVAMAPGNSGRGGRSILREHRKRLIATDVEVHRQVISILEDDTLSASSDMDLIDDDQDHSASAPIGLTPFSISTDDSVDESSTSEIATLSTLVQDSKLDHTGNRTGDPARFRMKEVRYQPCIGVRVSCPEGGGQRRSAGEGDIWAKSSFDQLRSTVPSCMDSSSLPLPLLPPLEGYETSSTYTMTSASLAREKVGSDVTADESPLRAHDEVLRRRKAATDRIIEYIKGSHGRPGNRD